tara:strand:+ start:127 stop:480 length:354 start_codon:yes stop_codon:yes gene_type:complete
MNYSFHRNLNATGGNRWSFRVNSGKCSQARTLYAENVTIKQPSGKAFEQCLQGGNRSVFAWFKTSALTVNCPVEIPAHAKRVRFNPKRGERFFSMNGQRIDFLSRAWLTSDGECFAI